MATMTSAYPQEGVVTRPEGWYIVTQEGVNLLVTSVSRVHGDMTNVLQNVFLRRGSSTRAVDGSVLKLSDGPFPSPQPATGGDTVAEELAVIRNLTMLSMNDIARLCGIKRRHVYNLLEGEPTETHRAIRIRSIARVITEWAEQFPDPTTLRSLLLAPLEHTGRDFIAIAASEDSKDVDVANHLLKAYVARLNGARPVTRRTAQVPGIVERAAQTLRDVYGEGSASPEA